MAVRTVSTKVAIDGESEYRSAVSAIDNELKRLSSTLKLVESDYKGQANTYAALSAKQKALQDSYAKQSEKVKELEAALKNAQSAQDAYSGRVEDAKAKISGAEAALKKLKESTGDTTEQEKALTAELDKYNAELNEAERYLAATSRGVNDWERRLNTAKVELNDLGDELKENSKHLGEAKKSTDGCATSIDEFGKKTDKSGDSVEDLTNALAAAGLLGAIKKIGEAFTACVKASVEFESAMAGVAKTTDLSQAELGAMSEAIKQLSLNIPITSTELANITETAGQLGVSKDGLVSFTETMANLGVATNMTSGEAATMLAQFSAITGMGEGLYGNLGSAVVALGNNFATNERKIADMSQSIAAAGTNAGISEANILALSAATTSLGIEAANGGTQMSKLISDMQTAVETGEGLNEWAAAAGMSAAEFAQLWGVNAVDAIVAFIGNLNNLDSSATVTLSNLGITETRMKTMITSLANAESATGMLSDALKTSNTAWSANTALATEAATRYATTESRMQLFKNAVNSVKVAVGDQLSPAIGKLADIGATAFEWVGDFIDQNPWMVDALASVAAGLAALGLILAGYTIYTTIIPKLTIAVKAFQMALLSSPVGMILTAVVALGAAIGTMVTMVSSGTGAVGDHIDALKASKKAYDDLNDEVEENSEANERLADTLVTLAEKENKSAGEKALLLRYIDQLKESIPGLNLAYNEETDSLNMTKEAVIALAKEQSKQDAQAAQVKRLSELYTEQAETVKMINEAQADLAENPYGESENGLVRFLASLGGAGMLYDITMAANNIKVMEDNLAGLDDQIAELEGTIAGTAGELGEAIGPAESMELALGDLAAKYEEARQSVYDSLSSQIGMWDKMDNSVKTSIEEMKAAADSQIQWYAGYAENLSSLMELDIPGVDMGPMIQSLSDGSTKSAAILAGLADASVAEISELANSIAAAEQEHVGLSEILGAAKVNLDKATSDVVKSSAKMAEDMDQSSVTRQSGIDTIQGYINGVNAKGTALNATMSRIAANAMAAWKAAFDQKSPSRKMEKIGVDAMLGNIGGIEKMQAKLDSTYAGSALSAQRAFDRAMPRNIDMVSDTRSTQTVNHTGTIRVEGVNDAGEMVGVVDIVIDQLRRDARI